jgi:hypothetical protein
VRQSLAWPRPVLAYPDNNWKAMCAKWAWVRPSKRLPTEGLDPMSPRQAWAPWLISLPIVELYAQMHARVGTCVTPPRPPVCLSVRGAQ